MLNTVPDEAAELVEDAFESEHGLVTERSRAELVRILECENIMRVANALNWPNTSVADASLPYVPPQDNTQPFLDQRHDIERDREWTMQHILGKGGQGTALLWLKLNKYENILDVSCSGWF